ncbi:g7437 [Coccomyxa elongata]
MSPRPTPVCRQPLQRRSTSGERGIKPFDQPQRRAAPALGGSRAPIATGAPQPIRPRPSEAQQGCYRSTEQLALACQALQGHRPQAKPFPPSPRPPRRSILWEIEEGKPFDQPQRRAAPARGPLGGSREPIATGAPQPIRPIRVFTEAQGCYRSPVAAPPSPQFPTMKLAAGAPASHTAPAQPAGRCGRYRSTAPVLPPARAL